MGVKEADGGAALQIGFSVLICATSTVFHVFCVFYSI
jgi:hypothetical protein